MQMLPCCHAAMLPRCGTCRLEMLLVLGFRTQYSGPEPLHHQDQHHTSRVSRHAFSSQGHSGTPGLKEARAELPGLRLDWGLYQVPANCPES